MEKQKNGFLIEEKILNHLNINKDKNYTNKYDADYIEDNIKYIVEIKSVKNNNEICFSSFSSKFDKIFLEFDFYKIIVVKYDNNKKIKNVYEVDIPIKDFIEMLGGDKILNIIKKYEYDIKHNITNEYSDDIKWKNMCKEYNKLLLDSFLKPRPKRDHKKQKRLQCAISQKEFYSLTEKYEKKNYII